MLADGESSEQAASTEAAKIPATAERRAAHVKVLIGGECTSSQETVGGDCDARVVTPVHYGTGIR
jgi:hypothetical protein